MTAGRPGSGSAHLTRVGIADMAVSGDIGAELQTRALGSCVAVVLWNPTRLHGGLAHILLPSSASAPDRAQAEPMMFADTAVPALFKRMYTLGSQKEELWVRVVGGARLLDATGVMDIGTRNYTAVRRILWANGVLVRAEDVGGQISRSVSLHVGTGRFRIWRNGVEGDL